MFIGNTTIALAKLARLIKLAQESKLHAEKKKNPAIVFLLNQSVNTNRKTKPKYSNRKIRLADLDNPINPFIAWYLNGFSANRSAANTNTSIQNIQDRNSFASRLEAQKKTD